MVRQVIDLGARRRLKRNAKKSIPLYFLLLLPVAWYIIFLYVPMGGLVIVFKEYIPIFGVGQSPWLEDPFELFKRFLTSKSFWQVVKNTVMIGSVNTVVCFIAPIVLSLMFNEMRMGKYKKGLQCVSYMPYFVSTIALVSIFQLMFNYSDGIVNKISDVLGGTRINFLSEPEWFLPLYVLLNLWKGVGWGTIIYTASMSGIDTQLYEAADIEGAGRFSKIFKITIPSIMPTLVVMMILAVPGFLGGDFETVLLLQTIGNRSASEILATYVYHFGLTGAREYSYAAAVGLFSSVINIVVIFTVNAVARKVSDYSLF